MANDVPHFDHRAITNCATPSNGANQVQCTTLCPQRLCFKACACPSGGGEVLKER